MWTRGTRLCAGRMCSLTPQTAGGLLIAADPVDADALLADLAPRVPSAQRIGSVAAYEGGPRIFLR